MATLTAASTTRESNGSLTLLIYKFSSVGTGGDTFTSGLGTSMAVGYWAVVTSGLTPFITADTVSAVSNGINVSENGGTFSIYTNASGLPVTLNVWAKI